MLPVVPFLRRLLGRRDQAPCFNREVIVGGHVSLTPKNISGTFTVSATSHIAERIITTGMYEPNVTDHLGRLGNGDGMIVNIGANIGLLAVHLALKYPTATEVVAIEPNPAAYRLLLENISANSLSGRIRPVHACIGEKRGEVEFEVIPGKPEYSSIGGIVHPAVSECKRERIAVQCVPLADVVKDAPISLLFIDVEGAEGLVFAGARDILIKRRPVIYFECCNALLGKFGHSSRSLDDLLVGCGYDVKDASNLGRAIKHPFEGDVIAFPTEGRHKR